MPRPKPPSASRKTSTNANVVAQVQTLFQQAISLHSAGNISQAKSIYEQVLMLAPGYAAAYSNLGLALAELGRHEDALARYARAIALQPDYVQAYYNQGIAQHALQQYPAALASYAQAIALQPDHFKAYCNRGVSLHALGQFHEAIASFDKSIEIQPHYAPAYYNRGLALKELNALPEALASFDRAIVCQPAYAQAYCNRGMALYALGQMEDALASYDQAIALDPKHAQAYWNKSLALLSQGDYQNGWPLYEWGWAAGQRGAAPPYAQPLWLGRESLQGKTLLLSTEQGLGDSIQFARFTSRVKALGARVLLHAPAALTRLFQTLADVDGIIPKGDALPEFDFYCPLLSLPLALGLQVPSLAAPEQYLASTEARRQQWAALLGPQTGLRVGLVCRGAAGYHADRQRSLDLETLLAYLPPGPHYICLQKELRPDEAALCASRHIGFFGDQLHDFADTAALCDCMDLIISVDTSVAHLAAALGKPTWIMLPYRSDWRWMQNRTDTPWYPTATLYRQNAPGAWAEVLERVAWDMAPMLGQNRLFATATGHGQ